MRRALVARRVLPRRSGSRRARSPQAGAAATEETGADRPDIVTAQQIHAVVAMPSDARRPVRDGRRPARRRRQLDAHLVAGAGPDPGSPLRPGGVRGRALPRHLLRAAAGDRRRVRDVGASGMFGAISNSLSTTRQPVQGLPRLLRRPLGADERVRRRRHAGVRRRAGCGGRAPPGVPGRAERHHRHPRAAARARRAAGRRPPPVSRRLRPPVRLTDRRPLPVRLGRPAQLAGARLQPRRLLRALGLVAGHPGFALVAPPRRGGGVARRGVLGRRTDHERPARARLHGVVLDAVGPGRRRDAGGRPGQQRPVRALDGRVQRRRCRARSPSTQPRRRPRSSGRCGCRSSSPSRARGRSRAAARVAATFRAAIR